MFLLLWTVLFVVFILELVRCWLKTNNNPRMALDGDKEKPLPPGSLGLPIIGETLQFLIKGVEFYVEKFKENGNIYKTHIMGIPTVRVSGAENVHSLVKREPDQLNMKWPTTVNILMGKKSLPTVVGSEHPKLRKHLQQAVTSVRLADYVPCIQENIKEHIQQWLEKGEEDETVLGYPMCESLMADIMLELVLGCRKEDDEDGKVRAAFLDVNHNLFSVPIKIPFSPFSRAVQAREVILDFVKSRMNGEGQEKNHVSMLDVLLSIHGQEEGVVDEEAVKDNGIGLLLAGAASTSGAMTCLMFLLGKHPAVLESVREELTLAGVEAGTDLNYDLLQKLEYVQCVVKESLRYMPPVGGCFRQTYNDMDLDKYRIPKDWTIIYSIRDTHKITEKQIPDGDVFSPSRWQKKKNDGEETEAQSPPLDSSSCTYIPFGSGPRICFGRYLAQMILQMFIVELALSTNWTVMNPDSPLVFLPITKPKDDLPLLFKKIGHSV